MGRDELSADGLSPDGLTAAVVLASANRPELLGQVIADVEAQTVPIEHRVLSVPDAASLPGGHAPAGWLLAHDRGLAAQRNAGIAVVPDADVIFFFDDDAVVRPDYVEQALAVFARRPDVVGLTGRVLLDGATRAEVGPEEAAMALKASSEVPPTGRTREGTTLYGCNFAYRTSVREVFDARLPLYSWLEDHDFARRLLRHGTLVKADDCVIVHRGVKSGGRMAHARLGYSQVMNPCYLVNKGSFPLKIGAWEIFRPVAKNVAYSLAGPERDWRRERVRGNALAAWDVARRRFTPERIRSL